MGIACFLLVEYFFAIQECLQDGNRLKVSWSSFKGVLSQNDKISCHTGSDAALEILFKTGPCAGNGEAIQCFLYRKCFLGQIGGGAVQVASGHGALDASQYIGIFYRTIAAVTDSGALLQQCFPAIAAGGQFFAGSLRNDVNIIVQEDALGVYMEVLCSDPGELIRTGDLTMDDAVAGICSGEHILGFLVTLQYQIQAPVANAVNSHLHVVAVGITD